MAKQAKQLWSEIDGEPWLDNPRRRRRRAKGRKRSHRRRRSVALAANPRRHRRRKRHGFALNPRRRRRHRGFRRNPGVSSLTRGLMGRVVDGAKGGLAVLLGEAAASAIPKLIPVAAIQTGLMNTAAEALTVVLTAPLVAKMIGPKWATAYLYGGFARAEKGVVIGLNVPIVSAALASYPGSGLSALPTAGGRSLQANFDASTLEAEEAFVM